MNKKIRRAKKNLSRLSRQMMKESERETSYEKFMKAMKYKEDDNNVISK